MGRLSPSLLLGEERVDLLREVSDLLRELLVLLCERGVRLKQIEFLVGFGSRHARRPDSTALAAAADPYERSHAGGQRGTEIVARGAEGVMELVLGRAGSFTGVAPKNERAPTVGRPSNYFSAGTRLR
jgi:hypothetical protein